MRFLIKSGIILSIILLVSSCLSFDTSISIEIKEANPLNVPEGADAAIIKIPENITLRAINGEE